MLLDIISFLCIAGTLVAGIARVSYLHGYHRGLYDADMARIASDRYNR